MRKKILPEQASKALKIVMRQADKCAKLFIKNRFCVIVAAPNLYHNNFFKIVEHKNDWKQPHDKIHCIHKIVLLLLAHLCRSAISIIIVVVTKSIIPAQKLHIGKYVTIGE